MSNSTLAQIVDYYVNLLIIQYNDKPKARATIALLVNSLLANNLIFDVREAFNIDTAVGVQLDILGKYIGVDRFYTSELTGIYFGYSNTTSFEPVDVTGYAVVADFYTKAGTYVSESDLVGNTFALSDENYRIILKLQIILNNSNFSNSALCAALFKFFGLNIYYIDNQDMSFDYFVNSDLGLLAQVMIEKNLLPAPMGVRINQVIDDLIYFGYSDITEYEAPRTTGYALVSDFYTKQGEYLGTDNFIG